MTHPDDVEFRTEDTGLAAYVLSMLQERGFYRIPLHCTPCALQYSYVEASGIHTFRWCDGEPRSQVALWKDVARKRNAVLNELAGVYGTLLPFDRDELAKILEARGIDANPVYMSKYLKSAGQLKCKDRRTREARETTRTNAI